MRHALDPWLGEPRRSFGEGRVTLIYRVRSEGQPPLPIRLEVEINSREHFSVFGFEQAATNAVWNDWGPRQFC